jgi:ribosomal protein S20
MGLRTDWKRGFFSQFDKMIRQNQRSAMKTYVKQVNSQIEEIVLEMRKFLTPSKKEIFDFEVFYCLR